MLGLRVSFILGVGGFVSQVVGWCRGVFQDPGCGLEISFEHRAF